MKLRRTLGCTSESNQQLNTNQENIRPVDKFHSEMKNAAAK